MSNKTESFESIEALLKNQTPHWQAFSQSLVNASSTCLLAVDHRRVIFLSNAVAMEKLGAEPNTSLHQSFPMLDGLAAKTIINGQTQNGIRLQINGVDFVGNVHPIRIGTDIIGAICSLNEATSVENVLNQMHFFQNMTRELDAIINSSSDGLFVCDAQANVIRMNPASELIHNAKERDLVGRNMQDLINEGFIDDSAALEASKTKKTVTLLQNKDGRKLISTGTPVFDDEGALIRVVVSEKDITRIDQLQKELEEQAALKDQLQHRLKQLQETELKTNKIIARSPAMLKVIESAYKVSSVDSSVLITGESGAGKGAIAKLIHNNSDRARQPLIRINCGAIPETLIESELFGYESGAFTGARSGGKPGSLELADNGTLFLDEIAELPLNAQVKLLRFLENGRVTRLGGANPITINARVLAATHQDLKSMISKGLFRHDLYYRLNVIPISIPALKDRPFCIPPLLRYYVDHFARITDTPKRLSRAALDSLLAYPYPGNVRELMNIAERIVVMSETEVIDLPDLPGDVARYRQGAKTATPYSLPQTQQTLAQTLEHVEKQVLTRALEKYNNQTELSKALGLSQPTIARRLKKYQLSF